MTDIEFAKLLGEIDEKLIWECRPNLTDRAPQKTVRTVPRFLSRAASVAAAAVLALFISTATAEAAGVRVVTPFVSWTGSTLRLDYSAGLDKHEDAPEITAEPSTTEKTGSVKSESISFSSEEDLKHQFGSMIRLPGKELELEFVEAKCSISSNNIVSIIQYIHNAREIEITAYHQASDYGTESSAFTVEIENTISTESKWICGIECICSYASDANHISAVWGNEAYLISGKVEMSVLEKIFVSMMDASK